MRATFVNSNHLSEMDFCTLCSGYDTIMTYVPITDKRFARICEKCMAKFTVEEIQQVLRSRWEK